MTKIKNFFVAVVVFVSFSVAIATEIHEDIINVFNDNVIEDSTATASQIKIALNQKNPARLIKLGLRDQANFYSEHKDWDYIYFETRAYAAPQGVIVIIGAGATSNYEEYLRVASNTWTFYMGSPLKKDPDRNLTQEKLKEKYNRYVLYKMSRLTVNQIIVAKVYAAKNGLEYSPTFTSYESNFGMAWKIISEAADEYGKRNGVTTPYELYALGDNFNEVWKNRKTRKILENLSDAVGKIVFN